MPTRMLFGALALFATSGCATLDRLTGPQRDPVSQLQALNERVGVQVGSGALCVAHTQAAAEEVAKLSGFDSTPVYSCPASARGQGVCHVSLLVTDPDGGRWVLDNGSVVSNAVGALHVASFKDYAERVDQVYWIGLAPDWNDIMAAVPDFPRERSNIVFASR